MSRGFSMRGEIKYVRAIIQLVFYRADTITVRLILANASIIWAIGAIFLPDTFLRHGYEIMAIVPRWLWALAFFIHGIGVYWRIFDVRQREYWALAVNSFGLFIWLLTTILINLAIKEFAIGTSLEWIMVFASAWALYRTGLKSEWKLLSD